jgi:hypothetical protein
MPPPVSTITNDSSPLPIRHHAAALHIERLPNASFLG